MLKKSIRLVIVVPPWDHNTMLFLFKFLNWLLQNRFVGAFCSGEMYIPIKSNVFKKNYDSIKFWMYVRKHFVFFCEKISKRKAVRNETLVYVSSISIFHGLIMENEVSIMIIHNFLKYDISKSISSVSSVQLLRCDDEQNFQGVE